MEIFENHIACTLAYENGANHANMAKTKAPEQNAHGHARLSKFIELTLAGLLQDSATTTDPHTSELKSMRSGKHKISRTHANEHEEHANTTSKVN